VLTLIAQGSGTLRVPIYQALLECCFRDGSRMLPGTAAAIWHAIDTGRASGGRDEEVRILEDIAVQVHLLRQALARLAEDTDADLGPRHRIAALTRQWTAVAPLRP